MSEERAPLPTVVGGPPADSDGRGGARLSEELVKKLALELEGHDESWVRREYELEKEHLDQGSRGATQTLSSSYMSSW